MANTNYPQIQLTGKQALGNGYYRMYFSRISGSGYYGYRSDSDSSVGWTGSIPLTDSFYVDVKLFVTYIISTSPDSSNYDSGTADIFYINGPPSNKGTFSSESQEYVPPTTPEYTAYVGFLANGGTLNA